MKGLNLKALNEIYSDLDDARVRLEEVGSEAEEYYDGCSDRWRDGEKGQEFEQKIGELEEATSSLNSLLGDLENIIGG